MNNEFIILSQGAAATYFKSLNDAFRQNLKREARITQDYLQKARKNAQCKFLNISYSFEKSVFKESDPLNSL